MCIIVNRNQLDMPALSHWHSSYEFTISSSQNIGAAVEKKNRVIEKNRIFPFNSEQLHGPSSPVSVKHLLSLQIDKKFLQDISQSAFGKSGVSFYNENRPFNSDLNYLVFNFMEETRNKKLGYQFILQSLSSLLAVYLLRQMRHNLIAPVKQRNYYEKDNIKKAIDFLHECYNQNFSLEEIALIANSSPYHFIRVFKKATGKTPHEYLVSIKIKKALEMLKQPAHTITEICFACGFNNCCHFSSVFKRMVGLSPSEYRKELTKGL